jgi:hypothetical protein
MISLRYVPVTCVLLALSLVPTIIHSYSTGSVDDGRRTADLPGILAGMTSTPSERNAGWGKRRFDSDDWTERDYRAQTGATVRLTVVRSDDAKTLYHHPELAVAYGTSFVGEDVERFPQRPEVPVHVLKPGPGVTARAMYVLHYDTRFIDAPIPFQVRTAGELLFSRRKPMTLFFALDKQPRESTVAQSSSATLLFAAVDAFLNKGSATSRPGQ